MTVLCSLFCCCPRVVTICHGIGIVSIVTSIVVDRRRGIDKSQRISVIHTQFINVTPFVWLVVSLVLFSMARQSKATLFVIAFEHQSDEELGKHALIIGINSTKM